MKNINLKSIVFTLIVIGIIISPLLVNNGVVSSVKGEKTKKVELYMENKYQTSNIIQNIFINNDFAYIARGSGGLEIINTSELPYLSRTVNYQHNNAKTVDVEVYNNIAYVLQEGSSYLNLNDSLDLYDVTKAMEAEWVGEYIFDVHGEVVNLCLDGNIAYIISRDMLYLIDVNNPLEPVKVGEFDFGPTYLSYSDLTVADDIAYVVGGGTGLHVLDVRDPANPTKIGYYETSGGAASIVVENDVAYVTEWGIGLEAINVSTPSTPLKLDQYDLDTNTRTSGLTVVDEIAFITYYTYEYWDMYTGPQGIEDSGIIAIDLSKPDALTEIGKYEGMNFTSKIFASNDLLYVVDDHDLCILRKEISETDNLNKVKGISISWSVIWVILQFFVVVLSVILTILSIRIYKKNKKEDIDKKDKFNYHLKRIDDTYTKNKTNIETLESGLISIKEEIRLGLDRGELNEGQYMILDKKIDEYLQESHENTKKETADNEEDIIKEAEEGESDVVDKVEGESEDIIEDAIRNIKSAEKKKE